MLKLPTLPVCFGRYQRGDKACDGYSSGDPPCLVRDRCVAFGIHLETKKLDRGEELLIDVRKEHSQILDPKLVAELDRLLVKHRIRDGRTHRAQRRVEKKGSKYLVDLFLMQLMATTGRNVVRDKRKAEAGDMFTIQRGRYIAVYGRPNHFDRVYVCTIHSRARGSKVTVRIAAPFRGKLFGAKDITGKYGSLCIEFPSCDSKRSLTAAKVIAFCIRARVIDLGLIPAGRR